MEEVRRGSREGGSSGRGGEGGDQKGGEEELERRDGKECIEGEGIKIE